MPEEHWGRCTYKAPKCTQDPIGPASTVAAAQVLSKQLAGCTAGTSKAHVLPPAQPKHHRGDSQGTSPTGAEPAGSSYVPLHNASVSPSHRASCFQLIWPISGTSPVNYTSSDLLQQRHGRRRLNRFSSLEKTALAGASCPPQPALLQGWGHSVVLADAPKRV